MEKAGVKRLIRLVSLVGARDDRDKLGLVAKLQQWFVNKGVVQGRDGRRRPDQAERPRLDDRAQRPDPRVGAQGPLRGRTRRRRTETRSPPATLAAFILDELKSGTYLRQMPLVHN